MHTSGKLVIVGILTVALASAAASWWFRYAATHKAVRFWGSDITELIRDARHVLLLRNPPPEISHLAESNPARAHFYESVVKVSDAPGLLHLRNALLEDQSFHWPTSSESFPEPPPDAGRWQDSGYWQLVFFDSQMNKNSVLIRFSKDCRQAMMLQPSFMANVAVTVSTEPIAAGLQKVFTEMWKNGAQGTESRR
jgi:hypothetical protein